MWHVLCLNIQNYKIYNIEWYKYINSHILRDIVQVYIKDIYIRLLDLRVIINIKDLLSKICFLYIKRDIIFYNFIIFYNSFICYFLFICQTALLSLLYARESNGYSISRLAMSLFSSRISDDGNATSLDFYGQVKRETRENTVRLKFARKGR